MARAVAGLRAGLPLARALETLTQAFRAAGIDTPQLDARVLAGHALGIGRARLVADGERLLDAQEIDALDALAARRIAHEPVARIVGTREFWSLALAVSPAVLVPRPDTETVVEAARDAVTASGGRQRPLRVLDIGTGTGALLLALLTELPAATGVGTDISEAALAVARDNAARLALDTRCAFVVCDIAQGVDGPFDLVVSNPPYIASAEIATLAPDVRDYDPRLALDGGPDGLAAYRAIAADAKRLLAPDGMLVVELGAGQEDAVARLFTQAGLAVPAPARKDLGGIARALLARRA
jgi:release factor glutamine methyltransferase